MFNYGIFKNELFVEYSNNKDLAYYLIKCKYKLPLKLKDEPMKFEVLFLKIKKNITGCNWMHSNKILFNIFIRNKISKSEESYLGNFLRGNKTKLLLYIKSHAFCEIFFLKMDLSFVVYCIKKYGYSDKDTIINIINENKLIYKYLYTFKNQYLYEKNHFYVYIFYKNKRIDLLANFMKRNLKKIKLNTMDELFFEYDELKKIVIQNVNHNINFYKFLLYYKKTKITQFSDVKNFFFIFMSSFEFHKNINYDIYFNFNTHFKFEKRKLQIVRYYKKYESLVNK